MNDGILSVFIENILNTTIVDNELYTKYNVKRGLRDISGKGVLAGLTEISEVRGTEEKDGVIYPIEGQLIYRGIDINKIIEGFIFEERFGFEETIYLLILGKLPNMQQLNSFKELLSQYRGLPDGFIRDVLMRFPAKDIMNSLSKSVLSLYSFDDNPDDTSLENILKQSLYLISNFSLLAVYSFLIFLYYFKDQSLIIHNPLKGHSIAENILHILRPNNKYTKLEARLLDLVLVLHAEHGGGNNSTFTNHVVSSSGTDTYAAVSSSINSLKGPKHGGANIKVTQMMEDLKKNINDWNDDDEISGYLSKILSKKAFDNLGLIYGMGHAVYSLSDPRSVILKKFAENLAEEKGLVEEFNLYKKVEQLAPKVISEHRKIYKGISANIDFYSGFVYRMLEIPQELFTPLFATARITGWSAHRIEEIANNGKIIRPAYKSVAVEKEYTKLNDR
ncbi:MAG TPA: citrate/2-methylcitrate synthase [Spirochaetota bacterium]|nr:citrate/2-methylcitrate synthase [Spirochaetota bacterium]HOS33759.1 citrate/2-methylcitrate synthase [Spirochaetota bacterium]HOS56762.1 citrate/2-methylcitrate synthase [Spirochaetota bacterium]HPK62542.1 citrate/2-methylcitrate synthase [Spirochaetota bacterium]HQF79008.1 citrate/2-methylcitrate synthase [Spirochaetota bacterium]